MSNSDLITQDYKTNTVFLGPTNFYEKCAGILAYSSKFTGLIPSISSLSSIFHKVRNLQNSSSNSYKSIDTINTDENLEHYIEIITNEHLAYAPLEGFDTLIYFAKGSLNDFNTEIPIGYTTLDTVIGKVSLDNIFYTSFVIYLEDFPTTEIEIGKEDLDTGEQSISDSQNKYLNKFLRVKDLKYTGYTELPKRFKTSLPFEKIITRKFDNGDPIIWFGYFGGVESIFHPLVDENNDAKIVMEEDLYVEDHDISGEDTDSEGDDSSGMSQLPTTSTGIRTSFISNFLISRIYLNTIAYYYPYVVEDGGGNPINFNLITPVVYNSTKYITENYLLDTNGHIGYMNNSAFWNSSQHPLPFQSSRPLLDLGSGKLISSVSSFINIQEFQKRVREAADINIPLSLLFTNRGTLDIYVKHGKWFIFNLYQFNMYIATNDITTIAFPKSNKFIIINDRNIMIRRDTGTEDILTLYDSPGYFCDEYTKNIINIRYPYSKLFSYFSIGGEVIDEDNIFTSKLSKFRKRPAIKVPIRIIDALSGFIFYVTKDEFNNSSKKITVDYM